ncbi:MAG: N-glycosylase/DNA lyase [Candidatus Woesearchaeota archaeon]
MLNKLRVEYKEKKPTINKRLKEFRQTYRAGDKEIFKELCYCILTANASARMGLKCMNSINSKVLTATESQLRRMLKGKHRFAATRASYITKSRDYMQKELNFNLKKKILSIQDRDELREFIASNLKGIGYKEASHFLRNIGFKGYAILDKHIVDSMVDLRLIKEAKPPKNKEQYLLMEKKLRSFSRKIGIGMDELDLLLWSMKTGEVLK